MVVRVADRTLALPVERVVETMRPLPLGALEGGNDDSPWHAAVLGVAQIRGTRSRVIDLGRLLGVAPIGPASATPDAAGHGRVATRFVVLRGGEPTALQVDAVIGVQTIDQGEPVRIFAGRSSPSSNMQTGDALLRTRSSDLLVDPLRELLAGAAWLPPQEGRARSPEAE